MNDEELKFLCDVLGREPNDVERGIATVMWSEHCSYKSSRIHLKTLPTDGPRVLQGPGENAGVVDIGDGLAVAFKMESHNHPSFIEPYQGAATGVGGILRDVFTMGARPIANLNSLRFGNPKHPKTKHLVKGVVAGIGGYGNTMGIPTVGGEIAFDDSYNGNILVNAFTIGLLKSDRIFRGKAAGIGNPVIYVGSKTGRDGIHGAAMASAAFDVSSEEKRPTVQVGDPFTEKRLMEACLELMETDAIVAIQDMGAAGLTSSSFEMASRGNVGMVLDLDRVPVREDGMTPYELMLSESQERMLLVVHQGREADVRRVFDKWDLDMAVVGYVTEGSRMKALYHHETVVDMPIAPIVREAPVYDREAEEPRDRRALTQLDLRQIPIPTDFNATLLNLLASPNIGCKSWVWEQYDHTVMSNTVILPGSDAAVIRIKGTEKAIALTTDCNSRYCYLDPCAGAQLAVAESVRNLSAVGATPLAVTDCLNFGNPERPDIMWQFRQAVRGLGEACRKFETPIVSGNVSFYNETEGNAIFPTPTVAMVGLLEHIDRRATPWWKEEGDVIILLGKNELDLGGTEYLKHIHGKIAGLPPHLDIDRERAVCGACRIGISRGFIRSAHDLSEGGLAVALVESSLMRPDGLLGARITLTDDLRPDALLFGESASRIVVSAKADHVKLLLTIAQEEGAPATVIGTVGGRELVIGDWIRADLTDVHAAWVNALPRILE